jgi:hypothetical protein
VKKCFAACQSERKVYIITVAQIGLILPEFLRIYFSGRKVLGFLFSQGEDHAEAFDCASYPFYLPLDFGSQYWRNRQYP